MHFGLPRFGLLDVTLGVATQPDSVLWSVFMHSRYSSVAVGSHLCHQLLCYRYSSAESWQICLWLLSLFQVFFSFGDQKSISCFHFLIPEQQHGFCRGQLSSHQTPMLQMLTSWVLLDKEMETRKKQALCLGEEVKHRLQK